MPSPRVLDLGRDAGEPSDLQQNITGLLKYFNDKKDNESIGNLLSEYQANREEAGAMEDLFLNVQKSNISPTKRLQFMQEFKAGQEVLREKEKTLNAAAKKHIDQAAENENIVRLKAAGATPEQISLYQASPVGGQTKIVENIIEENQRAKAPAALLSPDITDYDKGLTPKERVKRQDQRFTTQTPLVIKNSESLTALGNEELSLGLLNELNDSKKVGQGLANANINPKTGDLFLPKAASPEEQLFVKTVNDFTVKAKDSFGARVTNFELDRFMQRLPTLANSEEGRRLILRQMSIINEINQLEKKAIQEVFDVYGVRNIDYVDAENKAREQIKDKKESLRKEYLNLEQLAKKEDSEQIANIKEKLQPGYTAMRKPDGSIKQFPTKNVPNLEEKGYKKL